MNSDASTHPCFVAAIGIAIVAIAIGTAGTATAQSDTGVVRVALAGTDTPGCGAAGSPCQTLQFAVDEFPTGAVGDLLVSAGTYVSALPMAREVVRVTLRTITIQGGWNASFTIHDSMAYPVVVDGEGARKAFLVDCPVNPPAPCQLSLVDLTISNGSAPPDLGTRNAFGGAVDAFLANLALTRVDVVGNRARGLDASSGLPGDGGGGGISLRQASATLTDVRFIDNSARGGDGSGSAPRGGLGVGGALFVLNGTLALTRVSATGNLAQGGDAPTALGLDGGGVQRADGLGGFCAFIDGFVGPEVVDLTASLNRAEGGRAAVHGGLGLGGALFFQIGSDATLDRVHLRDNAALGGPAADGGLGGGGGIFSEDMAVVELTNSELLENRAEGGLGSNLGGTGAGGALYLNSVLAGDSFFEATNVVLGRNEARAGNGSGAREQQGFAFGGGLFMQCPQAQCQVASGERNEASFVHVTLADGSVGNGSFNQGSAVYVNTFADFTSRSGIVTGHNTPPFPNFDRGEALLVRGTADFADTLWHDNTSPIEFVVPGGSFSDVGAKSGSPAFVDPQADPPNYRIQASSAARDEAVGSLTPTDLDGDARPFGAAADLGADEFSVPEPTGPLGGLAALLALGSLRKISRPLFVRACRDDEEL